MISFTKQNHKKSVHLEKDSVVLKDLVKLNNLYTLYFILQHLKFNFESTIFQAENMYI